MKEREREPSVTTYERVPGELKAYPQWVNWRPDSDKKVPVNPLTLGNAGVGWPNTWSSFDRAVTMARRRGLRLGFVLTAEDPYTVVDLDKCVGEQGRTSARTRDILDLLAGWVELSPSGTGLHVWVRSDEPVNRRTKNIEVYSSARWITVTGRSNPHAPAEIPDRTTELAAFMRRYFLPSPDVALARTPAARPLADEEVWARLFNAKNGAFFASLFAGDLSVCADDHSRAVIMLANQLAAMTDLDAARIKRLLYQTGLVNEKWESRRGQGTWIDYQIADAIRYVAGRRC